MDKAPQETPKVEPTKEKDWREDPRVKAAMKVRLKKGDRLTIQGAVFKVLNTRQNGKVTIRMIGYEVPK